LVRILDLLDARAASAVMPHEDLASLNDQRILITGADGMLGRAFVAALGAHSPTTRIFAETHSQLDVTDAERVAPWASERPDIILHCAGLTNADQCERQPELDRRVHVEGTRNIVRLAHAVSARVFYPQSVFIFDGSELPVTEASAPSPNFEYGRVKLEAERHILSMLPEPLIVRMAGFFGGDEKDKNFVGQFTRRLEEMLEGGVMDVEVGDRIWQPSYTLDLASNCLLLLALGRAGVYHMGSLGEARFHEVAQACVDSLGLAGRIRVIPRGARPFDDAEPARRPPRMVTRNDRLDAEGLNRQRPWRDALHEYLQRPHFDRLRRASGR